MSNINLDSMSYGDLCAVGSTRADMVVKKMREDGNPLLLTSVIKEIGTLTPIQIGFFTRVACMLISQ